MTGCTEKSSEDPGAITRAIATLGEYMTSLEDAVQQLDKKSDALQVHGPKDGENPPSEAFALRSDTAASIFGIADRVDTTTRTIHRIRRNLDV